MEAILPDTRKFDGCIHVEVIINQDDPLNLVLYETWEMREHQEKYLKWRAETGALEAVGSMLTQPISFRYYDNLNL